MATNDERREAARRLREYSGGRKAFHLGRLCAACGIDKSRLMSRTTDADAEAWAHLADLIEPSCDRERLLAIATVMAADSVRSAKQGSSVSPVYILHAARDIAEACGETFGSIRNRDLTEWGTSIVPKELVVDRDALLALANDIDKQTDGSMFDAWLEDGHYIARRIREAVGA